MLNLKNEDEKQRTYFILMFCSILIISLITTLLICYFIRYKKKFYFDAAGRKYIESTGDMKNILLQINEIIQLDDIIKLEQEVVSKYFFFKNLENSLGFLSIVNENKQNLLHLSCIYGARECLKYLLNFGFLDGNKEDYFRKIPIEYLIANHNEENDKNKIMFILILMRTEVVKSKRKDSLQEMFNDWQNNLFVNFFKTPSIKLVIKD